MSRRKGVPSKAKETSSATSTSKNARPNRQPRECLNSSVLKELWSIWQADSRVPTVESRRLWASSRNVNPRLVGGWFLRRKTYAKKVGLSLPEGSYDLPLAPLIVPKREPSDTAIESEPEAFPDLPSDDTLVYPPDGDDLYNVEASSDTVFDEDMLNEIKKTEMPAYKDVFRLLDPEDYKWQPRFGPIDSLNGEEDRCVEDTPLFQHHLLPICNQAGGKESDFTCILCSKQSDQDDIQTDFGAISNPRGSSSIPCPQLDYTLLELSAIPFLFRSPSTVLPDNAVNFQSAEDWTPVEDELARLVNEGGLNFSFLDDPCLASMELPE